MEQKKNIRLLIATGLYPPEIGGPATYSRMLEEKLCMHGIDLEILPFGTVRHLPKGIRHIVFMWRLFKAASRADVLYALDSVSVGLPTYTVSLVTRRPFIIRLGGDYAWEQGQQRFGLTQNLDEYTSKKNKASLAVRLFAAVQSFVVRKAQLVIAPSEYLKRIIATWGVDPDRIRVIYSALFPLAVDEAKGTLREQLDYKGVVITTVGRLVPWKGFLELIEVVADVRKEIPEVSLVIIGDGPQHDALCASIAAHKLEDTVRLVGRLGKDALGAAIKASDLFVLNTSYEGLSHQLLEVMDLGVPIVTTNVGGNPELITDGVSGVLVDARDNEALRKAIVSALRNEHLRIQMTQNARVRIQDFSQDVVVAQLADLLKSLPINTK